MQKQNNESVDSIHRKSSSALQTNINETNNNEEPQRRIIPTFCDKHCMLSRVRNIVIIMNCIFTFHGFYWIAISYVKCKRIGWFGMIGGTMNLILFWMLAIGVIEILISMIGVVGSYQLNRRMLVAYNAFMIMFVIGNTLVVQTIFILSGLAADSMKILMQELFIKNPEAFHNLETRWKCCGFRSYKDYSLIPSSCCEDFPCTTKNVYQKGCNEYIIGSVVSDGKLSISLNLAYGVLQIIALCMSCRLLNLCPDEYL